MKIQRETVIAAALDLLDEVGIDGLTMRRLAQKLDIKAASLYWHFTNKQALMDGMADALMEGVARKELAGPAWSPSWFVAVSATAHDIRRALLKRRDGARVYAGTYVTTDNVFRVAEALIAPLCEAGASTRLASWGAFSILYYVTGFVTEEQPLVHLKAESANIERQREQFAALAAHRYPHALAAMDDLFDMDFDARFELGLDLLITGLDVRIKEERRGKTEK
ncbi:TetR/AcrR family transcriptional regulator C-terminal domain-containing protein [Janthinobacterium sp. SUN128]|uniref:TetR/AcrR family transcriptional regulator C-terminal domain-containing protein n=1 Tax=Janthinobacterium sp. SUN128 TaxID=3014790 RepID=UPI002713F753|nr:TetR/AcrR family transcriptional regulator C-terminal domain-containing protein [Janthinobacterium sp. SUN128]MDO8032768.1 TetR/AcrR family transcriptional regulator C-terminal domain-containing protein [Janthinobacterium sp. SUN128]